MTAIILNFILLFSPSSRSLQSRGEISPIERRTEVQHTTNSCWRGWTNRPQNQSPAAGTQVNESNWKQSCVICINWLLFPCVENGRKGITHATYTELKWGKSKFLWFFVINSEEIQNPIKQGPREISVLFLVVVVIVIVYPLSHLDSSKEWLSNSSSSIWNENSSSSPRE